MFWKTARLESEISTLRAKLYSAESQVSQYDNFIRKLRKFDRFTINSGGGITAYKKGEPDNYGTGLVVPDPDYRVNIRWGA